MYKISVIIVYTNLLQLEEANYYLNKQTIYNSIECIFLDNRKNEFSSAAKALNYGASRAHGEVLIFMHQDIYLWDSEAVDKIYKFLLDKENMIVGVAGVAQEDRLVHYNIYETKQKIRRALLVHGEYMPAVTLDECLFAMKKSLWNKLKFDEITCDNWHFYGAEICYHNILNAGSNVILSIEICHESLGNSNNKFFKKSLKKIIIKYKGKLKRIETPCINIRCNMFSYFIYSLKYNLKKVLKK